MKYQPTHTYLSICQAHFLPRCRAIAADLHEMVFLFPRCLSVIYNLIVTIYWTVVAAFALVIVAGEFSYRLGRATRGLCYEFGGNALQAKDPTVALESAAPVQLQLSAPALPTVKIDQLPQTVQSRIAQAPTEKIILARPWGSSWRLQFVDEVKTELGMWRVVNR